MFSKLAVSISEILEQPISNARIQALQPLINYIKGKIVAEEAVNINFICTHNSRRSHLAQVWAQIAAAHYQLNAVFCYSGGTSVTALHPTIAETCIQAGIDVRIIAESTNPIYMLKYDQNAMPIIGFSKSYDHPFNPQSNFVAVMTCTEADGACPLIKGAEKRIALPFEDPKSADHTEQQNEVYKSRSMEIASLMFYVFSMIKQ